MSKLLIILLLSLLTGCASLKDAICDKPILPENTKIHVDARLIEPCLPMRRMELVNPSFEDYLVLEGDNASIYVDCKKKQEASIIFIKQLGNIK